MGSNPFGVHRIVNQLYPILLALVFASSADAADTVASLHQKARDALKAGKQDDAVSFAGMAIALEPKNPRVYLFRGTVFEALQKHAEAVKDFDETLKFQPDLAEAFQRRGSEHFKLGHIQESLADFDKFLELRPEERPSHWQRGISLYYAGKYEEGAKQFALADKISINDVENAVWHLMCLTRKSGIDEARKSLLKIGFDRRVPLMKIYELFQGKATPEDVLSAARQGQPAPAELRMRLFYAHLYLGLYAEITGDSKKALEFLRQAAEEAPPHYMGDVARVHRDILLKK